MPKQLHATQHVALEWAMTSSVSRTDPFNEIEVDVEVTGPDGSTCRVPAFWGGDEVWRVRFAPPQPGRYECRSICTDTADAGLNDQTCTIDATPNTGDNDLLRRGPLRVSANKRHFEHADGTPFFYLADTWWMGLCHRIHWPDEFQMLAADRRDKGFTVVQIVGGPYPDMDAFDPRGRNEVGFPWADDFARVNPAYYDMADLRIQHLVRKGLVPCIVGCWGYYLTKIGTEKMKQHWRNLVARYAAYPVLWCLAGEGAMPYYLSENKEADAAAQKTGWAELGRYVGQIDPYDHPITIHPTSRGREQVDDDSVLDFEMVQTGHGGYEAIANTIELVTAAHAQQPHMPYFNSEVCYEGICGRCGDEIQRYMFFAGALRGACGHTYGANGIWQMSRADDPYGSSPHGFGWGDTPWQEAARLAGAAQISAAKQVLMRYPWWQLEPCPEGVEGHGQEPENFEPVCAGSGETLRVIYVACPVAPWSDRTKAKGLTPNAAYRVVSYDPKRCREWPTDNVTTDADGTVTLPDPPFIQDWLYVLDRA